MKNISRRRVITILSGIFVWFLGILFEDPVRRFVNSICIKISSVILNPYVIILTIILIMVIAGLLLYWKISDKAMRKKEYMVILIEELEKAQIAARHNHEVNKDINRILVEKLGKQAMLYGNLFPEIAHKVQNFHFQSLGLLRNFNVKELKEVLADYHSTGKLSEFDPLKISPATKDTE